VTLVYLDWDERLDELLRADAAVTDIRQLPRDLDDVFPRRGEGVACAAS